jgi:hypothetical protein
VKAKTPRTRVTLKLPKPVLALLALAKAVYAALFANKAMFTSPNPPLAQLASDTAALETAQTATETHAPGSIETRNAKRAALVLDLQQERAYVQLVADAGPENAATIAANAGMTVHKVTSHNKDTLTVKPSKKTTGAIDLVALAGVGRKAHDWEYSLDGKTWTAAPSTLASKTTIPGFTPGATVYVRHRPVTKTGPDPWSQVVSTIVV